MKISVFAYSLKGCETALKVIDAFRDEEITARAPARIINEVTDIFEPIPNNFREMYGELFASSDAMLFVGACGIAVREIAPFIKSKKTDPAVVCVDDKCTYVIPLLSGHIGGANQLAARLAAIIDAVPVITTATDINGRFSVDSWAAVNGYHISSMKSAKYVSALILEKDLPLASEFPVSGDYPPGTYVYGLTDDVPVVPEGSEKDVPDIGIYIGYRIRRPFKDTLRLIPKVIHLGIGCRRGTPYDDIKKAVDEFCGQNNIDRHSVKSAASIDLKKDEEGLLKWCEKEGIPISFYSSAELNAAEGDFPSSDFVKSITGTDNVCERAASLSGGSIIVHKTAFGNVTVAASCEHAEVKF